MAVPVSALQSIAPGSVIEMYELQLDTALHGSSTLYRFHPGVNEKDNDDIIWNGNTYQRYPVEMEGFEHSGTGQLPRPKIRISNALNLMTAVLLTLPDGLEGAKVTRIRTLARYIDAVNFTGNVNPYGTPDPTAEFPREIYYVDRKTVENRAIVEFELAAVFDLAGVRAPKRQCLANVCQWVYKSTECGYSGPLETCEKTLRDCENHFGENNRLPFGSFPGIGAYYG